MKATGIGIQELLVGDVAPPLAVQEFLKGEPVFELAPGNIYVVELWASWCGASVGCLPLLTKLQEQYPQVTFLGVNVKDPDLERVRALIAEESGNINYRIAVEKTRKESAGREGGEMTHGWFDASHCLALPEAYVVDRAGKIAWIGHPGQLDEPLARIVNREWDLGAAAAAHKADLTRRRVRERKRIYESLETPYLTGETATALEIIDEAVADNPDLELEFGLYKLVLLMRDREANKGLILSYGPRLMGVASKLPEADISRRWSELTGIAATLSQFNSREVNDDPTLADPDLSEIAVQAMRLAGEVPGVGETSSQLDSYTRLLHEAFFVHALMGNRQFRAARERAERVLRSGGSAVDAIARQNAGLAEAMNQEIDRMRSRIQKCRSAGGDAHLGKR